MIPREKTVSQVGTLPGKVTKMSISDEHMPHILGILTNMYSDIQLAILREISINALDSHKKAGNPDPIRVSTPNKLHPFLEIEDFGTGMSVDFVENEFSRYGASTKRGNNTEAGAFGIGGKSPLAYADEFTLTTRKDGVEGVFVVSRDNEGAAIITTLEGWPRATDEPDGVKFSIPVRSTDDFDEKVDWFFKFWEDGTVLVNDAPPRKMKANKLTDDVWFTPEGNNSYVVMGNIPYRVKDSSRYLSYGFSNFNYVVYVPVGAVSVTPNREALEYGDPATLKALENVGKVFEKKMMKMIEDDILNQPTHFEAWEKWNEWRNIIGAQTLEHLTYKGDKFEETFRADGYSWQPGGRRSVRRITATGYGYYNNIPIKNAKMIIVHDKTQTVRQSEPSSYWRQKVKWFFQEKKISLHGQTIYFLDEVPKSPWLQGVTIYTWADIKTAKNPGYVPRGRSATSGTVPVLDLKYGYWNDTPISDLPKETLYITPADVKSGAVNMVNLKNSLSTLGLSPTIIKLSANRWAKWKREHPESELLKVWLHSQIKIQEASIPNETWTIRSLNGKSKSVLSKIKVDRVNDPKVREVHKLYKKDRDKYDKIFNGVYTLSNAMVGLKFDYTSKMKDDWLAERYPLIDLLDTYSLSGPLPADFYDYLNMKYEKEYK